MSRLTRSRTTCLAAVTALAALALSACGGGSAGSDSSTITFAVADQSMSAATASYATVPETVGYFEEEGLDVQMQPMESALASIQAVASGQATCTYASTANALATIESDPSLAMLGTTNGNIFRTVAPKSSGLTSMADLEGKTIGTSTLGTITVQLAQGGMDEAGVQASDDQFLAVGYGAQAAQALKSGDIDAYSGYDGPNLVIEGLAGEELVDLKAATNDLTGTSSLVCRKDDIKENPDMVTGLWRAFFKGMVFAQTNPEAAVTMHWENFPSAKPSGSDSDALLNDAVAQLKLRLQITGGKGSQGKFGLQSNADLQRTIDTYVKYGIVPKAVADHSLDDFFDHSLVDEYNKFDVAAVKKQAKEWQQ